MNIQLKRICLAALTLAAMHGASASVTTFANNPTTNSVDFAAAVAGGGGSIRTLTFDDQTSTTLNANAYADVTFTAQTSNPFTTIANGAGPGQGNVFSSPLSSGEGVHAASNYLTSNNSSGSLVMSFAAPVYGAGLFTIDVFNPNGTYDVFSLSAYSGADGTGTLLGTATGAAFNFQANNLYFLGVYSSAGDIGSVVFTQNGDSSGDYIGLDDVQIATGKPTSGELPEPGSLALVGLSLLGLALARQRVAR